MSSDYFIYQRNAFVNGIDRELFTNTLEDDGTLYYYDEDIGEYKPAPATVAIGGKRKRSKRNSRKRKDFEETAAVF